MPGRHEVRWLFHATAMVRDYVVARDALVAGFGCRVLEDTVIERPMVGRRGGMTWIGDNALELAQPIVTGAPADEFVRRFGPGMHSVAVQVRDLDATAEHLARCGVRISARPDTHLLFTHPKDTHGVFVEWFVKELDFDPRFGASIPELEQAAAAPVSHLAWVGAVVARPVEAARDLARLFDTEVTFADPGAPQGQPLAGVSLVDSTLALFALPEPHASVSSWGGHHPRPRIHVMGLRCEDPAGGAVAVAGEAGLLRVDDLGATLRPEATGHVPVVLVDHLLPGDPRTHSLRPLAWPRPG